MDAARAISSVLERIRSGGLDYPTGDLEAAPFDGGWCVYAPEMIADDPGEDPDDPDDPGTRSVFLVSGTGRVEEVSSSEPVQEARLWFEEACVWFTAEEPPGQGVPDPGLPPHPDLGGASRPRPPAGYDREAVDVLARALTHERDFGGWLAGRLRELADLLGGGSRLTSRRPRAWAAGHIGELVEPGGGDAGERTGVWRDWPAIDPASLPDADTTGWLLVPFATTCGYLEALEAETGTATPVADAVADRARQAPRWRACGVAEMLPQLGALRRTVEFDAALDRLRQLFPGGDTAGDTAEVDEVLGTLFVAPSPADGDVEALLRIAIDADRHHREVIDIDIATTAAYRRVLDRLDLPFENYWFEAMYE